MIVYSRFDRGKVTKCDNYVRVKWEGWLRGFIYHPSDLINSVGCLILKNVII